jgi:hypothetical protein
MWQTRALELNNQAYWNWEKACELVDYAVAHDFNTVIVGQVDLFDKLVSPKVTRRTITTIVSQASSAPLRVSQPPGAVVPAERSAFLSSGEEFNFPTDLLLAHPHLFEAGQGVRFDVDFWCAYLSEKVSLICQRIPFAKRPAGGHFQYRRAVADFASELGTVSAG